MPDRRLFLFNDIFSVLFCMLIPDFKVRDMILRVMLHILHVKEKLPKILEKVFFLFPFNIFYLGSNKYGIPCGTVVTGMLDMRPGKHDLHFLVDVEILPHAIVKSQMKLFTLEYLYLFLLFILFSSYNSYNIYLFLVLFLL
jgi:hypothetical protein